MSSSIDRARRRVWKNFVCYIGDDDTDFEELNGRSVGEFDITTIGKRAMKHATGHESVSLFKIGYMLYFVQNYPAYNLDSLAHIMTDDWNFPGDDFQDPNLPNFVRDRMFFPCHLVEQISKTPVKEFIENGHNPHVIPEKVRMHLKGYNPDGSHSLPHQTVVLDRKVIIAIMCVEIWCTWASRNRSPLPNCKAFVELFGPTAAMDVKELMSRLKRISEKEELWEYLCIFYTDKVEFLANIDALNELATSI